MNVKHLELSGINNLHFKHKVLALIVSMCTMHGMNRFISQSLLAWMKKDGRKPLILRGARQVGKTWVLKEFGSRHFPRVHYVNFEEDSRLCSIFDRDLNPARILQELAFAIDSPIDPRSDLIVFDEIQECPKALTSLKYFAESIPTIALCAAGSLLGLQLSDASFPVGKVDLLTLHPLSFEEFLDGIGDAKSVDFLRSYEPPASIPEVIHAHIWEQLMRYFVVGGLPEAVNTYREMQGDLFNSLQRTREVQRNLVVAYMADMAKHSGKQNSMHLERVWRNIPAQLARTQDGSAPKFRFRDVVPGVSGYGRLSGPIDWLLTGRLLIRAQIVNSGLLPFSAYSKESFFKLYLFDIGILGSLSGLSAKTILGYAFQTYKGFLAENFVAQEFTAAGQDELFCWRESTAEVEFLREAEGSVLPVEVKSGWVTQSKSLTVFARKYHPAYRTILSANNVSVDRVNAIHRYPLYLAFRFPFR